MHIVQPLYVPAATAANLANTPVFNPQLYALRRLVDNSVDTLDSIEVMQLDLRQRWQTKRGLRGTEHVVDWMTLDVQASIFPHSQRDNFGNIGCGRPPYDWVWNIGDRTALVSNGWFEPIQGGPHVFNIGTYIGRPDKTTFYLGYRQIDPLQSKAVISTLSYAFSAKYAISFGANFDFGNNIQSNSLSISRIGTDVTVSLGFTYTSIVNTFGVQFEIVPNLLLNSLCPAQRRWVAREPSPPAPADERPCRLGFQPDRLQERCPCIASAKAIRFVRSGWKPNLRNRDCATFACRESNSNSRAVQLGRPFRCARFRIGLCLREHRQARGAGIRPVCGSTQGTCHAPGTPGVCQETSVQRFCRVVSGYRQA